MAGASTSSTAVRMSHLGELSAAATENGVAVSFLMAQEKTPHFLLQGAPRAAGHILATSHRSLLRVSQDGNQDLEER